MLRPVLFFALPLVALASVAGQKTELPVQDLVRPARLTAALDVDNNKPRLEWIHRQLDVQTDVIQIMGEGTLLRDCAIKPFFDAKGLCAVLAALTKFDAGHFEINGDLLLVDNAEAPAALAGLSQLRRQLPPRIALEVDLERHSGAGRETLMHVRQSVRAGSTVTFGDLVTRRILRDYDVEIAQSAAIANPIVGELATGACLAVRPRVVPGRGELLIEAFARVAGDAKAPPIETLQDDIGPIDRAARQLDECGVAMRVPRGARRSVEWTAANGDRLRLTCAASWEDTQPGPRSGTVVRCRGLFHKGVAEFRTDSFEPDEKPAAFAAEAAFNRAGAESVLVIAGKKNATVAIVVTGAKADQIDADVASRLTRTLGTAELEISLLDLAAGVELGDTDKQGTALARIMSPVILGRSVAFSGRTEMRYLHDWDAEVAQSSRIPDPKVRVLRHGYHVDARVIADGSGRLDAVALDASVVRLARIDLRRATLSRQIRAGGVPDKSGTISPSIVLPKDVAGIESPVLHRHSVSTMLQLDEKGTAVMRRAAPRLLGKGRDLVVIVRVKK
ncbi:MAG: hypothetical protein ACYTGW_21580 [Planctomycetota bacterium]|jgi:hypothetical protein